MLVFIVVVALAVARLRQLFAAVMLFAIFSLLAAANFVTLEAVDVAFTEAAVGAGISTILMLATLSMTRSREERAHRVRPFAWLAAGITGSVLIYAAMDFPNVGDPLAPAYQHVAPRYLQESGTEIGIPNVVTSVLASYRGYDTLGEVTVIFTAGIGVICLLGPVIRLFRSDEEE